MTHWRSVNDSRWKAACWIWCKWWWAPNWLLSFVTCTLLESSGLMWDLHLKVTRDQGSSYDPIHRSMRSNLGEDIAEHLVLNNSNMFLTHHLINYHYWILLMHPYRRQQHLWSLSPNLPLKSSWIRPSCCWLPLLSWESGVPCFLGQTPESASWLLA